MISLEGANQPINQANHLLQESSQRRSVLLNISLALTLLTLQPSMFD